jgi:HD-like signal output (HDOD) protein
MTEAKDLSSSAAKTGQALDAQRFQMLKDIAEELAGDVVFPVNIDLLQRLRKALPSSADLDAGELARLVGVEPLIAARLMGLAHAAQRNPARKPARNLKSAIERIGTGNARAIALAITGEQLTRSRSMVEHDEFSRRLWDHSLYAASAAHVISRKLTRIDPEEAMLAGLVHDLGAFYMLYRATQYDELRVRPDSVRHLIRKWHESIGHALLVSLDVPEFITEAIRDHDQPRQPPSRPRGMADVVYLSNLLARDKFGWQTPDAGMLTAQLTVRESCRELADEIDTHQKQLRSILYAN